ncbi:MAG: 8-amino-7-oxononanoate synthase [Burkholderiales bacterium]
MPFSVLQDDLTALEAKGLRRRRRTLDSAQSAQVVVDGKNHIAFCSNDYLGLANHPALIAAAQAGAATYGVGAGASHLVLGHARAHENLEQQLATFVGLPRALLFSTGYMANLGVVTALLGREDAVFADRLNHASLNDACLLSRAQFKRFAHNDLAQLESLLIATKVRRKLIVVDAVFSMDGDIAPVPELLALAERHDAWLLLDDAHGFGVLGANGRGVRAHFNVQSPRIIYMATLGKAAGGFGAFVAGDGTLIETLMQRARTYIYTTAMPPLLACAVSKGVELMASGALLRKQLNENIIQLKHALTSNLPEGWQLLPSITAIQPLVIGDNRAATNVAEKLAARGVLVPAIRPPTVPQGTARLRISLSAAHTQDDVRMLCDALIAAGREIS